MGLEVDMVNLDNQPQQLVVRPMGNLLPIYLEMESLMDKDLLEFLVQLYLLHQIFQEVEPHLINQFHPNSQEVEFLMAKQVFQEFKAVLQDIQEIKIGRAHV